MLMHPRYTVLGGALLCAAHLHGVAADQLVENGIGPAGLTASETIDAARRIFNAWIHR